MKKTFIMLVLGFAAAAAHSSTGGDVVGNFGISAQIDDAAGLTASLRVNPPKLGEYLKEFAIGELWLEEESGRGGHLPMRLVRVSRLYPEYRATFDVENRLVADVNIFAPIGMDPEIGFLPTMIVEVAVRSQKPWKGRIGWTLKPNNALVLPAKRLGSAGFAGLAQGPAFIGLIGAGSHNAVSEQSAGGLKISTVIALSPGMERKLIFALGSFDQDGRYATRYPSARALLAGLAIQVPALKDKLREFVANLPKTGDTRIDEYLRWYLSASILLTKGTRGGDVLVMAYRELNTRDNFWASGIHLVFWKDLERRMIIETAAAQLPSGLIPTTVLPIINPGDQIDINELFVLRVARYYFWHRDQSLLVETWPAVKKAIAYLAARDVEGVGVPRQESYWADWKDVAGVQGRRYAPYFTLLWVASLEAASKLAMEVGDVASASDYDRRRAVADAFINRPFEQGGLWDGGEYADRWDDGRKPAYVLYDQIVGAYFNVIDSDKLQSIYRRLGASETQFGIRETYPYITGRFEQPNGGAGDYHNGGIWPYWNFIDATTRYATGRAREAETLIREVGQADLEREGDWQPSEYLQGDTGANRGYEPPGQCADAVLFSTLYFGAFGVQRVSDSKMEIRVRTPREREFITRLVLPDQTGTLSSRAGELVWQPDARAEAGKPRLEVAVIDERAASSDSTEDWAKLYVYRDANAALETHPPAPRVVFMGESITDGWAAQPFIRDNPQFVGRGIGGQTASQMLVRFRRDVVDLKPSVVHLMAGGNDVAENAGAETDHEIEGYIASMAELARINGIKVVLASIPPAAQYPWRPYINPRPRLTRLNAWLKEYAKKRGLIFADYWPVLATPEGAMRPELSIDGVHLNSAGYRAMQPIAQAALDRALGNSN